MSSHLLTLGLDYFLAEICDISEVQQFISISHEVAQQVVLVTQELILAEVINAEIIDSDIIHAIILIVSQASPVGSPSSSPGGFSFSSSHELLDSLKPGHSQACEHECIYCALIHCLTAMPPPIDTGPLAITSLQPLSRMALGTAMVAVPPLGDPATCLSVRLPTRALFLVLALSIYSGFALSLRTGFRKMICKGFGFLRRLRLVVLSGFTSISSSITIL